MQTFTIPADVAEHLNKTAVVMEATAKRLEQLHRLFGDGEEDRQYPDGTTDEWSVSLDHSEVERLIHNARSVASFVAWLSKFGAETERAE